MNRFKCIIIYLIPIFVFTSFKSSEYGIKIDETTMTPQALLKSKKWNITGKSVNLFFEYTDSEEILHIDGEIIERNNYYISQTNCFGKAFDKDEVGDINGGRFLVTENGGCYYLTVLNENVIQVSYLSDSNPHTTTLIAMN